MMLATMDTPAAHQLLGELRPATPAQGNLDTTASPFLACLARTQPAAVLPQSESKALDELNQACRCFMLLTNIKSGWMSLRAVGSLAGDIVARPRHHQPPACKCAIGPRGCQPVTHCSPRAGSVLPSQGWRTGAGQRGDATSSSTTCLV